MSPPPVREDRVGAAESLIASVAEELEAAIRQMFPEKLGEQARRADDRACLREIEERHAATLRALVDGD